jgi:hypothetical protein
MAPAVAVCPIDRPRHHVDWAAPASPKATPQGADKLLECDRASGLPQSPRSTRDAPPRVSVQPNTSSEPYDPPPGEDVGSRRLRRDLQNFDTGRCKCGIERGGELRVPVANRKRSTWSSRSMSRLRACCASEPPRPQRCRDGINAGHILCPRARTLHRRGEDFVGRRRHPRRLGDCA